MTAGRVRLVGPVPVSKSASCSAAAALRLFCFAETNRYPWCYRQSVRGRLRPAGGRPGRAAGAVCALPAGAGWAVASRAGRVAGRRVGDGPRRGAAAVRRRCVPRSARGAAGAAGGRAARRRAGPSPVRGGRGGVGSGLASGGQAGRVAQAGVYAGRAGAAARASGDPLVLAAAARAAATQLRRAGRAGQAVALLQEAHDELAAGGAGAAYVDAGGMVALTAAYTAAQARDRSRAVQFAGLAEEMAGRLAASRAGVVGRVRELSVQQCVLYQVGDHRELGDPDTALVYAARLVPGRLLSPERRARTATDTARALLAAGDTAGAFGHLLQVEHAAPLEARRPAVRAAAHRLSGGAGARTTTGGCRSGHVEGGANWSRVRPPGTGGSRCRLRRDPCRPHNPARPAWRDPYLSGRARTTTGPGRSSTRG